MRVLCRIFKEHEEVFKNQLPIKTQRDYVKQQSEVTGKFVRFLIKRRCEQLLKLKNKEFTLKEPLKPDDSPFAQYCSKCTEEHGLEHEYFFAFWYAHFKHEVDPTRELYNTTLQDQAHYIRTYNKEDKRIREAMHKRKIYLLKDKTDLMLHSLTRTLPREIFDPFVMTKLEQLPSRLTRSITLDEEEMEEVVIGRRGESDATAEHENSNQDFFRRRQAEAH